LPDETSLEKLEKLRMLLESEQINQLIQYHANSLAQSQISFNFSIGAASLGFLVIILGVVLVLFNSVSSASYLSIASGAIIDAVAALFFVQSNQARKSMTEFLISCAWIVNLMNLCAYVHQSLMPKFKVC
jgi:hypothetical protein